SAVLQPDFDILRRLASNVRLNPDCARESPAVHPARVVVLARDIRGRGGGRPRSIRLLEGKILEGYAHGDLIRAEELLARNFDGRRRQGGSEAWIHRVN